jgi:hypothetical protein
LSRRRERTAFYDSKVGQEIALRKEEKIKILFFMSTVERTAFYRSKVGQEIARQALALLLVANLQKKKRPSVTSV